jgi:hypothetical protein
VLLTLTAALVGSIVEAQSIAEPPGAAPADSVTIEESNTGTVTSEEWLPPEPDEDGFDWILQIFDWEDVSHLRSPRTQTILFWPRETARGPVLITPTIVTVGGAVPGVFSRYRLMSITPSGSRRNLWSGKISAGTTLRSGNQEQEQIEYNGTVNLQRRHIATKFLFEYRGEYSKLDGVEKLGNHRVNIAFDVWLSRKLYLVIPLLQYYRNPIQNIQHQAYAGAGLGYYFVRKSRMEWSLDIDPTYQQTWFSSFEPDEPSEVGAFAMVISSLLEWDITRRLEFILQYQGQVTRKEIGETNHNAVSTLEIELTRRFDIDLTFEWDRISNPKVGADGVQPEPDDFSLTVSLAWEI